MDLAKTDAFQRWWEEDWSWEGLAKKFKKDTLEFDAKPNGIHLRNNWQQEEQHLIEFAGRRWTRYHLPPFDSAGNAISAGLWNQAKSRPVWNTLIDHIRSTAANAWRDGPSNQVRSFSDLQGVVFSETDFVDTLEILSADFSSSIFMKELRRARTTLALFDRAIFFGVVTLNGSSFLSDCSFQGAEFLQIVRAENTAFHRRCNFSKTRFHEKGRFQGANFQGITDFSEVAAPSLEINASVASGAINFNGAMIEALVANSTKFNHGCEFKGAHIGSGSFDSSEFNADVVFFDTEFQDAVSFRGTRFKANTRLEKVRFLAPVSLDGALCEADMTFNSSTFAKGLSAHCHFSNLAFTSNTVTETLDFENAEVDTLVFLANDVDYANFRSTKFDAASSFNETTFGDWADFSHATFIGWSNFADTRFLKGATFLGAKFQSPCSFSGALFHGTAQFRDAHFLAELSFDGATFFRDFDIGGTESFEDSVSFRNATFADTAIFSDRRFRRRTSFADSTFLTAPEFYHADLHTDTSFADTNFPVGLAKPAIGFFLRTASKSEPRDRHPWVSQFVSSYKYTAVFLQRVPFLLSLRWPGMRFIRQEFDDAAERQEGAYRHLRHLCAKIGSHEYEALFQRLELQARQSRTTTRPTERLASLLYGQLSDFGVSMGWPLVWLAVLWICLTDVYLFAFGPPYSLPPSLNCGAWQPRSFTQAEWIEQAFVAVGRQFLPSFFRTSQTATSPDWSQCAALAHPFWFFTVGALQSVFFIACIALFLIALRRSFRLKD